MPAGLQDPPPPADPASLPLHLHANLQLEQSHITAYLSFSNLTLQHDRLFTARGNKKQPWSRIEVPLGWIGPAIQSDLPSSHPFKHLWTQHSAQFTTLFEILQLDAQKARQELMSKTALPNIQQYLCHASIGIAKPKSPAQLLHQDWDSAGPPHSYWSLAVPITSHPNQGHTEFQLADNSFKTYPASYFWQGHAWHKGGPNKSQLHRVVLFFAFLHPQHPSANPDKDDNLPHKNAIPP